MSLDYDAEAACPSAEVFRSEVTRWTQSVAWRDTDDAARVLVTLSPTGGWGRLRIAANDGPASNRVVEGTQCDELVRSLAFVLAVAVDPHVDLSALVREPATETPGDPATAAEPEASADDTSEKPENGESSAHGDDGASSRSTTDALLLDAEPSALAGSPAPSAAQSNPATSPISAATEGPTRNAGRGHLSASDSPRQPSPLASDVGRASLGVAGRIESGLGTQLAPGLRIHARGRWLRGPSEQPALLSPGVALGVTASWPHIATGEIMARGEKTALDVEVCPLRLALSHALRLDPCLVGELGSLSYEPDNFDRPQTTRATWAAGGLTLSLVTTLSEFEAALSLGARLNATRPGFSYIDNTGEAPERLFRVSQLSVITSLTIEAPIFESEP